MTYNGTRYIVKFPKIKGYEGFSAIMERKFLGFMHSHGYTFIKIGAGRLEKRKEC